MMRILIELTAGNVTNIRGGGADSTVNKNARLWARKVVRWLLALIRKVTLSRVLVLSTVSTESGLEHFPNHFQSKLGHYRK